MREIKKIAIIGAGELGSRHLQGLTKSHNRLNIEVVDTNDEALRVARERYESVCENLSLNSVKYYSDINELSGDVYIAIIATTSSARRRLIEYIAKNTCVKYLLLEKFLFPAMDDYDAIGELLEKKEIKAWVNCPRRYMESYQRICGEIGKTDYLNMSVVGSNLGIACNGIHFFDLFGLYTGFDKMLFTFDYMDEGAIESHRKGYIDFVGSISVGTNKGTFSLYSSNDATMPTRILINCDKCSVEIREDLGIAMINRSFGDTEPEKMNAVIRYQSEMTGEMIDDIMERGSLNLTGYSESAFYHKILLGIFLQHMSKDSDRKVERCNVT